MSIKMGAEGREFSQTLGELGNRQVKTLSNNFDGAEAGFLSALLHVEDEGAGQAAVNGKIHLTPSALLP